MSTRQVLYIALLGLGLWGCRTPRGMLQAKEGQAPITCFLHATATQATP